MSGPVRQPYVQPQQPVQTDINDPNVISEPMPTPAPPAPSRSSGPTPAQVKAAQDIIDSYNATQNAPQFPEIDAKYQEAYDTYFNKTTPHADRGKVVLAEDVSTGVTALGVQNPDGSIHVSLLVTVGDYSKLFGG